jgi:hypothetical protein
MRSPVQETQGLAEYHPPVRGSRRTPRRAPHPTPSTADLYGLQPARYGFRPPLRFLHHQHARQFGQWVRSLYVLACPGRPSPAAVGQKASPGRGWESRKVRTPCARPQRRAPSADRFRLRRLAFDPTAATDTGRRPCQLVGGSSRTGLPVCGSHSEPQQDFASETPGGFLVSTPVVHRESVPSPLITTSAQSPTPTAAGYDLTDPQTPPCPASATTGSMQPARQGV